MWCSVVVFFVELTTCFLSIERPAWGEAGETGARRVCGGARCPRRRTAARGVLRHAAAPRWMAGGPRRALRAGETVLRRPRTGVGTRARAFSAGGGAHGGTTGVNTAPRGLTCVRGGPRVSAARNSGCGVFRCLRARGAARSAVAPRSAPQRFGCSDAGVARVFRFVLAVYAEHKSGQRRR